MVENPRPGRHTTDVIVEMVIKMLDAAAHKVCEFCHTVCSCHAEKVREA